MHIFQKLTLTTLRKVFTIIFCCFICLSLYAQKNASVSGRVLNEDDKPLAGVSVQILNSNKGIATNDSGYFVIHVEAGRSFALVFSFTGYKTVQKNFLLNKGEEEKVAIKLERAVAQLKGVTVTDSKVREQTGLI